MTLRLLLDTAFMVADVPMLPFRTTNDLALRILRPPLLPTTIPPPPMGLPMYTLDARRLFRGDLRAMGVTVLVAE